MMLVVDKTGTVAETAAAPHRAFSQLILQGGTMQLKVERLDPSR
jgi:hypothetical protein